MAEQELEKLAPIIQKTEAIREGRPAKVTLVTFPGLGTVELPGWEKPKEESLTGARLGLEVNRGKRDRKSAMVEASRIDHQFWRGSGRSASEPVETPALNALHRALLKPAKA